MIIQWKKLTFSKTRPHQEVIQAEGKINQIFFKIFFFSFFAEMAQALFCAARSAGVRPAPGVE